MRDAVISDIHGNYVALRSVLKYIQKENIDKIINCGDIVGYGPEPQRCVDTIRALKNIHSVIGNHDWAVVGLEDTSKFNSDALTAVNWTRDKLDSESLNFLSTLDYRKGGSNFMFLHGSPRDPLDEYIFGISAAEANFKKLLKPICFVGHTHAPVVFRRNTNNEVESLLFYPGKDIKIEENFRYIINPGSVGQPRDGNPDSSLIIYDTDKKEISLKRIPYDITKTQNLILDAGLPEFLASRLAEGE
ncbi:MAG: metallophosphoesterase family protein [Elusimicrobia bacterium]|jgi:predicted phosphodiesterase|nr:metallophosphoesterase family protein [Elusimicrobiota bacterium]